jgi:F-type H+-transporting ATPase subunit epsilon
MAEYRRPFPFELLTPDGRLCAVEAVSAVLPASDGLLGVLGGHAPLVTMMGAGPLIVHELKGPVHEFYVAGGFAHVRDGALTIVAEEAAPLEEMDREAAWEEIRRARALPAETDEEVARRDQRLAVARTKFSVVQKYYKRTRGLTAIPPDLD